MTRAQVNVMCALINQRPVNWAKVLFELIVRKNTPLSVCFGRILGIILETKVPDLCVGKKTPINASKRINSSLFAKWDRKISKTPKASSVSTSIREVGQSSNPPSQLPRHIPSPIPSPEHEHHEVHTHPSPPPPVINFPVDCIPPPASIPPVSDTPQSSMPPLSEPSSSSAADVIFQSIKPQLALFLQEQLAPLISAINNLSSQISSLLSDPSSRGPASCSEARQGEILSLSLAAAPVLDSAILETVEEEEVAPEAASDPSKAAPEVVTEEAAPAPDSVKEMISVKADLLSMELQMPDDAQPSEDSAAAAANLILPADQSSVPLNVHSDHEMTDSERFEDLAADSITSPAKSPSPIPAPSSSKAASPAKSPSPPMWNEDPMPSSEELTDFLNEDTSEPIPDSVPESAPAESVPELVPAISEPPAQTLAPSLSEAPDFDASFVFVPPVQLSKEQLRSIDTAYESDIGRLSGNDDSDNDDSDSQPAKKKKKVSKPPPPARKAPSSADDTPHYIRYNVPKNEIKSWMYYSKNEQKEFKRRKKFGGSCIPPVVRHDKRNPPPPPPDASSERPRISSSGSQGPSSRSQHSSRRDSGQSSSSSHGRKHASQPPSDPAKISEPAIHAENPELSHDAKMARFAETVGLAKIQRAIKEGKDPSQFSTNSAFRQKELARYQVKGQFDANEYLRLHPAAIVPRAISQTIIGAQDCYQSAREASDPNRKVVFQEAPQEDPK